MLTAAAQAGAHFMLEKPLARTLAELMFGDSDALIQIDMSVYM